MGAYIPRIVSPITGEEAAAAGTGSMVRRTRPTCGGSRLVGGREHGAAGVLLVHLHLLDHRSSPRSPTPRSSGRHSPARRTSGSSRPRARCSRRRRAVVRHVLLGLRRDVAGAGRARHGRLRLRIVADILKTVYLRQPALEREPDLLHRRLEHGRVGSIILLSGFNQPLLLLVIAACLNGVVMFVYSILLIQLNRRAAAGDPRARLPPGHAGRRGPGLRRHLGGHHRQPGPQPRRLAQPGEERDGDRDGDGAGLPVLDEHREREVALGASW